MCSDGEKDALNTSSSTEMLSKPVLLTGDGFQE